MYELTMPNGGTFSVSREYIDWRLRAIEDSIRDLEREKYELLATIERDGTFDVFLRNQNGEWEFEGKFQDRKEAENFARNQDRGFKICTSLGEAVEAGSARI
jgi:hypothetical protein